MAAPLKSVEGTLEFGERIRELGRRAKRASRVLALAPSEQKDAALTIMADALRAQQREILVANAQDLAEARASGASAAFLDRRSPSAGRGPTA
jgi:glutamate-5-semialdehyde dehydrogenase